MTRKQIEECYANKNGIITEHGKFEGEPLYVVYFWQAYLEGMADDDNGEIIRFYVTSEDKNEFPELKKRRTVRLIQRDDGFVCEV